MRCNISFICLLAFFSLYQAPAFGQVRSQDTSSVSRAVQVLSKQYTKDIGNNSRLMNGPEYRDYKMPYVKGHQFFSTNKPQLGSVHYDGVLYTEVPLQYDLKLDKLVMTNPSNPLQIKLLNERIKYFVLAEHTFIWLKADSVARHSVPAGFYDLLADGKVSLLAKRIKSAQEKTGLNGKIEEFEESAKFFLRKENEVYTVSSKKSITKLLSDKKSELELYARQRKMKFKRTDYEASATELVKYYNLLQSQATQQN